MVDSYSKMTIGQYDAIRRVLNDEGMDDVHKDIEILKVLGVDMDRVKSGDVGGYIERAKFLLEPCPSTDKPKEIRAGKYRLVMPKDITYAQYVDVCSSREYTDLLSCLLIPKGHSYNDGYKDSIDWGSISLCGGKSCIDFFIHGLKASSERTLRSTLRWLRMKGIFSRDCRERAGLLRDTVSLLSSIEFMI